MVQVTVQNGLLIAEVEGLHKIWACKSRLEIPLEHIRGVSLRPEDAQRWWHGWKVMGTDMPGMFAAGLFRTGDKWVFWDVRRPENTIEIDLADEHYDRLILEVEDPEASISLIQSSLPS